jgi:hypothetical protein
VQNPNHGARGTPGRTHSTLQASETAGGQELTRAHLHMSFGHEHETEDEAWREADRVSVRYSRAHEQQDQIVAGKWMCGAEKSATIRYTYIHMSHR